MANEETKEVIASKKQLYDIWKECHVAKFRKKQIKTKENVLFKGQMVIDNYQKKPFQEKTRQADMIVSKDLVKIISEVNKVDFIE